MKILARTQFLELPGPVVFAKYSSGHFGALQVRLERRGSDDYFATDLAFPIAAYSSDDELNKLTFAEDNLGAYIECDIGRVDADGEHSLDQLFAVYESSEVRDVIEQLWLALMPSHAEALKRELP